MNRTIKIVSACLATVLLGFSSTARASSILYDNGTGGNPCTNTTDACHEDAWTMNFGGDLSNSFTLSSSTTITGVTFWAWLFHGDTITSMDWKIGTSPNDGSLGSGTASGVGFTSTEITSNSFGDVDQVTFPISVSLPAGTGYWLTLGGASGGSYTSQGNAAFWDQDDGPSTAWENMIGFLADSNGDDKCGGVNGPSNSPFTCSESFELLGNATAVPEPSTLALLGAVVGVLTVRRFRNS